MSPNKKLGFQRAPLTIKECLKRAKAFKKASKKMKGVNRYKTLNWSYWYASKVNQLKAA